MLKMDLLIIKESSILERVVIDWRCGIININGREPLVSIYFLNLI